MNIQERQQLIRFLEQLAQTQVAEKDGEADALIREACARQADAAYLLVQRAMLAESAWQNSQSEIARLHSELELTRSQFRSQAHTGEARSAFIDANSWGNSPATRPTVAPATPPAAADSAVPATANAWNSGMLGTMATTAAGVVAGGLLYQGIGQLRGNQRPPSGATNSLTDPDSGRRDSSTTSDPQDDGSNGLFDTSSVDDYIASDADGNA